MNQFLLEAAVDAPSLASALSTAKSVLSSAWGFISNNPVLFGACALGLLTFAIIKVKRFF